MHGSMDAAEQPPASGSPGALIPADADHDVFAKRGCCGFWIPFSRPDEPKAHERTPQAANTAGAAAPPDAPSPLSRRWRVSRGTKAFAKVREWSELVAGPKWKTFIRRFHRNRNAGGRFGYGGKFGYDPLSYARNFDEGQDSDSEGDGVRRGFSSRYVAPPASTKSSMDLGGRDAPAFLQEGY